MRAAEAVEALASYIALRVPGKAYKTIRKEIEAYGGDLSGKAELVALSKVDAVDADTLKDQLARLKRACGHAPLRLSAATNVGVTEALRALLDVIGEAKREDAAAVVQEAWRP